MYTSNSIILYAILLCIQIGVCVLILCMLLLYYLYSYKGRRCSDDARQVSRGLGVIGPKGRWRNNLINKIINSCSGKEEDLKSGLCDYSISPVVRQVRIHM